MPYLHIFHFTYIWRHIFGGFCWFQISIVQSMQKIISITAHILDIVSLKHRHEFRTVSVSSTLSKLSRKICASVRREIPRTHLIKGRKRFIIQSVTGNWEDELSESNLFYVCFAKVEARASQHSGLRSF